MNVLMILPELELRGSVRRSFNLLTELKIRGHDLLVLSPGGAMRRTFGRLEIPMLEWQRASRGPLAWLQSRELLANIKTFNPDIVHLASVDAPLPWREILRGLDCPAVVTAHSARDALTLERRWWERFDGVIAVSHLVRQALVHDAQAQRSRIRIIHPGARCMPEDELEAAMKKNTQKLRPVIACYGPVRWERSRSQQGLRQLDVSARPGISGRWDSPLFGDVRVSDRETAANLEPGGEFDAPVRTLLRAARKLRERGHDFLLLLVGDGDASPFVREWIDLNDAGSWVILVNELYDHRGLYGPATMVIGVTDSHDTTQFALEAMGQGVPAIFTAKGGNFELIDDERSGLLYPPDDPDALSQRIERLLGDSALRLQIAREGYQRVKDRLSLERMGEETIDLYRECLLGRGKPSDGARKSLTLKRYDRRDSTLSQFIPRAEAAGLNEETSARAPESAASGNGTRKKIAPRDQR